MLPPQRQPRWRLHGKLFEAKLGVQPCGNMGSKAVSVQLLPLPPSSPLPAVFRLQPKQQLGGLLASSRGHTEQHRHNAGGVQRSRLDDRVQIAACCLASAAPD